MKLNGSMATQSSSRRREVARAMLAAASLALVAGCAGSGAPEHFYALSDGGVVVSSPVRAASTSQPSMAMQVSSLPGIVVSAVTIPELVDRPQIVTRDSVNRVIVSEQNLWAESVKSGIARTLATRLARALDASGLHMQVGAYPQTSIADPALRITVDIVRFDAVPNGEAVVDALWSIRRPADDLVRTGHTIASSPIAGVGYDAIVHGWNEAVAVVDRDIAAAVLEVGPVPPAPSATQVPAPPAASDASVAPPPRRVPHAK